MIHNMISNIKIYLKFKNSYKSIESKYKKMLLELKRNLKYFIENKLNKNYLEYYYVIQFKILKLVMFNQ